jgi:hypothetical protein
VNFEANNGNATFNDPTFKDFDIYEGKSIMVERSYLKGVITSKTVITYSLKPKRSGKLILDKVVFEYNDKMYETNPVEIYVKGETSTNDPLKKDNKIFVVANISNYKPYCYQPVTVDYKLYYDEDIEPTSIEFDFESEYLHDFLVYSIKKNNEVTKEKIKEREFNCMLIKTDVIRFKQLYDTYIDNLITVGYRTKRTQNDESIFENSEKILPVVSDRIKVQRINFPKEITSFGNYKMETFPSKKEKVRKNEIFEIKLQIDGEGYVEDEMIPKLYISEAFEVISNSLDNDRTIENGKIKTVAVRKYKIKPLYKGDFTIYPVQFNFYNEDKNEAKVITSKKIQISVK